MLGYLSYLGFAGSSAMPAPEFCNDSDSSIGCVFISCRTSIPAMGLGASTMPKNLTHNFNMMG